jgi:hypothetical protein
MVAKAFAIVLVVVTLSSCARASDASTCSTVDAYNARHAGARIDIRDADWKKTWRVLESSFTSMKDVHLASDVEALGVALAARASGTKPTAAGRSETGSIPIQDLDQSFKQVVADCAGIEPGARAPVPIATRS